MASRTRRRQRATSGRGRCSHPRRRGRCVCGLRAELARRSRVPDRNRHFRRGGPAVARNRDHPTRRAGLGLISDRGNSHERRRRGRGACRRRAEARDARRERVERSVLTDQATLAAAQLKLYKALNGESDSSGSSGNGARADGDRNHDRGGRKPDIGRERSTAVGTVQQAVVGRAEGSRRRDCSRADALQMRRPPARASSGTTPYRADHGPERGAAHRGDRPDDTTTSTTVPAAKKNRRRSASEARRASPRSNNSFTQEQSLCRRAAGAGPG